MKFTPNKNVTTVAMALLVGLIATVGVDRFVGVVKYGEQKPVGIIFTPNSEAVYEAADFGFRAKINSLGFRDREFSLQKTADFRVIAIGDSYTYGWGVGIEEAWPKVLEGDLNRDGLDVEVADLGSPGASPVRYAEIAEKAIPILKPDLVVVGVLQGDDVEQLKPAQPSAAAHDIRRTTNANIVTRFVKRLYPNLLHALSDLREKGKTQLVTSEWEHEAQSILSQFNSEEMSRYQALDKAVRDAFESGRLNPPLIQSAIKHPDYWMDTFDPHKPDVDIMINELTYQLARIKKVANEHHAKVIVVSIPMGIYVNNEMFNRRLKYGFQLDRQMLVSDSQDREIELAAQRAGLRFFKVTQAFRQNADANFFFKLDTHLNRSGHHFYADQLTPAIETELKSLRSRS